MRFSFHPVESLPKLAWCAVLSRSDGLVQVFHGPWVETCDRFFVEGVWDEQFKEGGFDVSYLLMGSGAKIIGDKVLFTTPCHTLENLHIYKTEEFVYVSSSMVFLLKIANCRLDMNYIPYEFDLLRQMQGLKHHVIYIPLDNGDKMLLCRYRNVEIDSDLEIHIHPKPEPPSFKDFAGYKTFLVNGLSSLAENARDPVRTVRYNPLTTISSGYDSSACAAIAVEIGCTEAATVLNARDQYNHAEDSGAMIGELMGLRVREYEQDAYKRLPGFPEAEFAAMGDGGPDVVFAPMADLFYQRLVITGVHGDVIWERQNKGRISRDIVRLELHSCTLTEFRLRVGFIHVPVPFFGCLSYPSIHEISNSEEMLPWSLGGSYDRPIARRLVEEKGVARDSFAREKKAVTARAGRTTRKIKAIMTPQSFESFTRFYEENKKKRTTLKQTWRSCISLGYRLTRRILRRLLPRLITKRFQFYHKRRSFMLHWGISLVENRYEID